MTVHQLKALLDAIDDDTQEVVFSLPDEPIAKHDNVVEFAVMHRLVDSIRTRKIDEQGRDQGFASSPVKILVAIELKINNDRMHHSPVFKKPTKKKLPIIILK